MSHNSSNPSQPRSASHSKGRLHDSMPEEVRPTSYTRPRGKSGLRIEDKLLNNQIITNKRLEALRKSLEQEEMKEVRNKPKILQRSRILAEVYDKKFFQQAVEIKEPAKPQAPAKPNFIAEVDVKQEKEPQKIIVESLAFHKAEEESSKKANKSMLNPSIVERSKARLGQKPKKIAEKKLKDEEQAPAECTFSPVIITKSKFQKCGTNKKESSDNSFISSPQSIETIADSSEHPSKPSSKPITYRALAPYQVKVSFTSGIDIPNFMRRAR